MRKVQSQMFQMLFNAWERNLSDFFMPGNCKRAFTWNKHAFLYIYGHPSKLQPFCQRITCISSPQQHQQHTRHAVLISHVSIAMITNSYLFEAFEIAHRTYALTNLQNVALKLKNILFFISSKKSIYYECECYWLVILTLTSLCLKDIL